MDEAAAVVVVEEASGPDYASRGAHKLIGALEALDPAGVLVRGRFGGYRRPLGPRLGLVAVDWVYNSMHPLPGQIYPPVPLEPVSSFE